MQEIQPLIDAVQHSLELCRRVRADHLTRLAKSDHQPVTIADFGVQAIVGRALAAHFPGEAVIAEESGAEFMKTVKEPQRDLLADLVGDVLGEPVTVDDLLAWMDHGQGQEAECVWVIDPIDGTRGYLEGQQYVIGVGLLERRRPMGAVLGYDNRVLVAWDGNAFAVNGGEPLPLTVGNTRRMVPVRKLDSSQARNLPDLSDPPVERIYAQLEAYTLIATAQADLYVCRPLTRCATKVWDHVAGVALVEAAGGTVTDADGARVDFSQGEIIKSPSLVVTNGHIHAEVLAALGK